MTKNNKKTVYYVCFYSEANFANKIISYPSVWSKIEYIANTIKKCGYQVQLVIPTLPINGWFSGRNIYIDENEKHKYFNSFRNKHLKVINKINGGMQYIKILVYLLLHVKKFDKVVIYHSMFHIPWAVVYKHIFRKRYILEIEDIYSALSNEGIKFEKREWNFLETAAGYLCVNTLISKQIQNISPKIISHGSYLVPPEINTNSHKPIRLVYAGVIEQVRNGAFLAARTIKYLPANYELWIMGFGTEKDIGDLHGLIMEINQQKGAEKVRFLGYLSGQPYTEALQQCDIALSTHMYDSTNMKSADYTFPSKLLVYMANNLQVVAQNLQCLRTSQISDCITFYEEAKPEEVAKAVQLVGSGKQSSGRNKIKQLDEQFYSELCELLKGD